MSSLFLRYAPLVKIMMLMVMESPLTRAMGTEAASDIKSLETELEFGDQRLMPFRLPDLASHKPKEKEVLSDQHVYQDTAKCHQHRSLWLASVRDFKLSGTLSRDSIWSAVIQVSGTDYWWANRGESYADKNIQLTHISRDLVTLKVASAPIGCELSQWVVQLGSGDTL
jgi:hypothetical protein